MKRDLEESSVAKIVKKFLEERREGRPVTIDDLIETLPLSADRTSIRGQVLNSITQCIGHAQGRPAGDSSSADGISAKPAARLPELDGFDMLSPLGQGGMGVVYKAYQRSTGRFVAIKFMWDRMLSSDLARHRFEREVELVARLQHPHIVSVMDSGIQKGHYYCVMEYVEGIPLDVAFEPGRCNVDAALRTMAVICEAVDYAHQRGVLHRDLKPSNILIDERGQPHLLDFGLAKAIDPGSDDPLSVTLSEPGQLLGTLGYMSPEQSRGQVEELSVRSDVYALGAIGYELIAGRLPCAAQGAAMADILDRIAHHAPPAPSSAKKGIHADVDAILLKALDKIPAGRYATAGDLAADIGRYLGNEPIWARRTGMPARMWRWARRNRLAAGVMTFAVAAVMTLTSVYFVKITHERDRVRSEMQKKVAISTAFQRMLNSVDPDVARQPNYTVRELLDDVARNLDFGHVEVPEVEASIRETLGRNYITLGRADDAERQLQRTLEIRRAMLDPPDEELARAMLWLGAAKLMGGKLDEAEPLYRSCLEMRRRLFPKQSVEVAESLHGLAVLLTVNADYPQAEDYFARALSIQTALLGESDRSTAMSRNNYAWMLMEQGRYAEARPHLQQAIEGMRRFRGQETWEEARCLGRLAKCLAAAGELPEAKQRACEALCMQRRLWREDDADIAKTLELLARLLDRAIDLAEAEATCGCDVDVSAQPSE